MRKALSTALAITAMANSTMTFASGGGPAEGPPVPGHRCTLESEKSAYNYNYDSGGSRREGYYTCAEGVPKSETKTVLGPDGKPKLDKDGKAITETRQWTHYDDPRCADPSFVPLRDQLMNSIKSALNRNGTVRSVYGVWREKPQSQNTATSSSGNTQIQAQTQNATQDQTGATASTANTTGTANSQATQIAAQKVELECRREESTVSYQKALLITSYSEWSDGSANISMEVGGELVGALQSRLGSGWQIKHCVLPVVFDQAVEKMARCYNEMALPPSYVISLGQAQSLNNNKAKDFILPPDGSASSQYKIRLDVGADNKVDGTSDNRHMKRGPGEIWRGSSYHLAANYPYMEMYCALPASERWAVEFRWNSDDYVCNYTSFQFLDVIKRVFSPDKRPRYSFVHVPERLNGGSKTVAPIVSRLATMIETAVKTPKSEVPDFDSYDVGRYMATFSPPQLTDLAKFEQKFLGDYLYWLNWRPPPPPPPKKVEKKNEEKEEEEGKLKTADQTAAKPPEEKPYEPPKRPDKPALPDMAGRYSRAPVGDIYYLTRDNGDKVTFDMTSNTYKVETQYGYYLTDSYGWPTTVYRDMGRIQQARDAGRISEVPIYYLEEKDCAREYLHKVAARGGGTMRSLAITPYNFPRPQPTPNSGAARDNKGGYDDEGETTLNNGGGNSPNGISYESGNGSSGKPETAVERQKRLKQQQKQGQTPAQRQMQDGDSYQINDRTPHQAPPQQCRPAPQKLTSWEETQPMAVQRWEEQMKAHKDCLARIISQPYGGNANPALDPGASMEDPVCAEHKRQHCDGYSGIKYCNNGFPGQTCPGK